MAHLVMHAPHYPRNEEKYIKYLIKTGFMKRYLYIYVRTYDYANMEIDKKQGIK